MRHFFCSLDFLFSQNVEAKHRDMSVKGGKQWFTETFKAKQDN